jgi:DNA invertase Pin-like site-specific DNA recombinase
MNTSESNSPQPPIRAAAYVRMSTEHQQYSTSNQMDMIREYALRRNMEIVKIYSDEGKSGLNIQGRDSLTQMISDVECKKTDFTCILAYDVSRWGRFQDADESAFYEYICRRAGISVHYCAEQFENDGSLGSSIIKTMKRSMAGEYSRELSTKVFQGACRLIQLGFKQGGTAGYGLRRMLVDQNGVHKGILKIGEQKSIQTDRVILVPGPEEEITQVRWMYETFVREEKSESDIANALNNRGILTDFGRAWTRATVHEVLTNEKYIGNNVYHRTSFKLKMKHVENPSEKWIRAEGAFEGIIDTNLFFTAQGIILARSRKLTDDEMLEKLRDVLKKHGRVSGLLIDETGDLPSSAAFRHRFGSLVSAYRLIGYDPEIDYSFIEINRKLRQQYPEIIAATVGKLEELGASVIRDTATDLLQISDELRVSIVLCRHLTTPAGSSRWMVRLDEGLRPDITIAIRMNASNDTPRDYYLLPAIDMTWENLRVAEDNGIYLDAYRFDSLDYFFGMAERCRIEEAA